MPKYTTPVTLGSPALIRSTDWNTYFGTAGNIQWAYDELKNISGANFIMLKNSTNSSLVSLGNVHKFRDYSEAYGNLNGANTGDPYTSTNNGVIEISMHAGYVWVSACISHTISNSIVNTSTPTLVLRVATTKNAIVFNSSSEQYTAVGRPNLGNNGGAITNAIAPLVKSLSISFVMPVHNGPVQLLLGVSRLDADIPIGGVTVNHFTAIPLADVSGLANFINSVEQIIE